MNKNLKNLIKFLLFVSFGAVLFYLVYKDTDFKKLIAIMADVKWVWFLPAICIMLLSHVSRAIRWNLLLESSGNYKPRFSNTFFAVMNMYFVNLGLPRVGEVSRSVIVSKYDNIPVSKVLGTMVTERATDLVLLILITVIAFVSQGQVLTGFLNSGNAGDSESILLNPMLWVGLGILMVLGFALLIIIAKGYFDRFVIFAKIGEFIRSFTKGLLAIFKLKRPVAFIFHSILIYILYYSMLLVCFQAFPNTTNISMLAVLAIFVAGSFGMIAPVPNGVGAWHYLTIQALMLYGIANVEADAFAFVVHGIQTVVLLVAGLACTLLLPLINRNYTNENTQKVS